jgi:hypothetical protein
VTRSPFRADRGARADAPLYRLAAQTVDRFGQAQARQFRTEARRALAELQAKFPSAQFELDMATTVRSDHPNLVSLRTSRYRYAGGAHGSSDFRSFTFGWINGKAQPVTLGSLFQPRFNYRAELGLQLARKLSETERASAMDSGALTGEQALARAQWNIGKSGLEFAFGHYEVNSYAEGTIEVTIPYDEIQGLNPASAVRYALR